MNDLTKYALIKEIINNFDTNKINYYESESDRVLAAFEHIKLIINFEDKKDKNILNE